MLKYISRSVTLRVKELTFCLGGSLLAGQAAVAHEIAFSLPVSNYGKWNMAKKAGSPSLRHELSSVEALQFEICKI